MKSNITLRKFYNLIGRTTKVTLISQNQKQTFFEGFVKDIPDELDNYTVGDFEMTENDGIVFVVKKSA